MLFARSAAIELSFSRSFFTKRKDFLDGQSRDQYQSHEIDSPVNLRLSLTDQIVNNRQLLFSWADSCSLPTIGNISWS